MVIYQDFPWLPVTFEMIFGKIKNNYKKLDRNLKKKEKPGKKSEDFERNIRKIQELSHGVVGRRSKPLFCQKQKNTEYHGLSFQTFLKFKLFYILAAIRDRFFRCKNLSLNRLVAMSQRKKKVKKHRKKILEKCFGILTKIHSFFGFLYFTSASLL